MIAILAVGQGIFGKRDVNATFLPRMTNWTKLSADNRNRSKSGADVAPDSIFCDFFYSGIPINRVLPTTKPLRWQGAKATASPRVSQRSWFATDRAFEEPAPR